MPHVLWQLPAAARKLNRFDFGRMCFYMKTEANRIREDTKKIIKSMDERREASLEHNVPFFDSRVIAGEEGVFVTPVSAEYIFCSLYDALAVTDRLDAAYREDEQVLDTDITVKPFFSSDYAYQIQVHALMEKAKP